MNNTILLPQHTWYKGWNRLGLHLVFWMLIFFAICIQASFGIKVHDWVYFSYSLRTLIIIMLVHYFFALYAIPKLLIPVKIFSFIIVCLLSLIFMTYSMKVTFYSMNVFNLTPPLLNNVSSFYLSKDFLETLVDPILHYNTIIFNFFIFFTVLIKITKDFFTKNLQNLKLENKYISLEKENIKLELNFLKSQIHPHFFFNTLNNIYSLISDKDEIAADIVLRLSNLMRYSLYESNNNHILLTRELDFLSDYVRLEQIRHKNHVSIKLDIEGITGNYIIPPLILITFVENAFKHGINKTIDASYVNININIINDELIFYIENSKPLKFKNDEQGGIGILNIKRRLDIMFKDRYILNIQNEPLKFKVHLKIKMDEKAELHNSGRRAVSAGSY